MNKYAEAEAAIEKVQEHGAEQDDIDSLEEDLNDAAESLKWIIIKANRIIDADLGDD